MSNCVFCAIVQGQEEASFVYRDELVSVFLDVEPINPGHLLVVPNLHATDLAGLPGETGAHLFRTAQRMTQALRRSGVRCEGVNLWVADGAAAGQEVFHVHLHVLPRFEHDGFGITLPQHASTKPPRAELDMLAANLLEHLAPTVQSHTDTIIRTLVESDYAGVFDLVEGLPEWFDATARTKSIPIDIRHQRGFVAIREGKVAGFITLFVADGKLNIGWLGVRHDLHRQGIGRLLLAKAMEVAQEIGVRELATYTLGDGVEYEAYARTRQFYFANGFYVYQRSQTDNEGCPEEIKIAKNVD